MNLLYILSFIAVVLVLGTGFFVSKNAKNTIEKGSAELNENTITGKELANKLILQNGLKNITAVNLKARHTNYYSFKYNVLKFDPEIANSTSISALAVCAYHTNQAKNYQNHTILCLIKSIFDFIFKVISFIFIPLVLICAILNSSSSTHFPMFLLTLTLVLYCIAFIVELIFFLCNFKNINNCLNDLKSTKLFSDAELKMLHENLKTVNKIDFFNYTRCTLNFLWFISPDFLFRT